MKVFILGCGAVGSSFIRLLKENGLFNRETYYCIDFDKNNIEQFINYGGKLDNCIELKIDRFSVRLIYSYLNKNDYLLDFANSIKNLELLEYCLIHGIHYLSTADSSWDDDETWLSNYQHYLVYKKFKKKYNCNYKSSLVMFGMPPGLVSIFAVKCLKEIILKDNGIFISKNRKYLLELFRRKLYGKIAKIIGVQYIKEIDNDNQTFNVISERDTIYSPWSPIGFLSESLSPSEIAMKSVLNINDKNNLKYCLLHRDNVISGGESVGIIISGEKFKSRYYGNYLELNNSNETATILQVSASAYAGFVYLLNNENKGLLFAEDLDYEYILNIAKKYLKNYISVECEDFNSDLGASINNS